MCTKFHQKMWRSTLQMGELMILSLCPPFISSTSLVLSCDSQNQPIAFMAILSCRSFSVLVKDLNGKNHQMRILNLLYPINVDDSCKKVSKHNKQFSSVKRQKIDLTTHFVFQLLALIANFSENWL